MAHQIHLGADAFAMTNGALWLLCNRTAPFARAYVGGTFDLPHVGHFALLARARRLAREVVVSVNTDAFVERYKCRTPVMPLEHRLAVMQHCRLVDHVLINEGDEDSRPAILRSGADVILHADDWSGPSLWHQLGLDGAWLDAHQIAVVIVPYTRHVSSTALRARVAAPREITT